MKLNKTKTLFALIVALILSVGMFFVSTHKVSADERFETDAFFVITEKSGTINRTNYLDGTNLIVPVKDGSSAELKRDILLDDLDIKLYLPSADYKVSFVLSYDSKLVNGNPVYEEEAVTGYKKDIENVIEIPSQYMGDFVNVKTSIDKTEYLVTIGETEIDFSDSVSLAPKTLGGVVGRIGFKVESEETESAEIKIEYINQRASFDEELNKNQKFVLDSDDQVIAADPVIIFTEGGYATGDEKFVAKINQETEMYYRAFHVSDNDVDEDDLYVKMPEGAEDKAIISGNKILFRAAGDITVLVAGYKDLEEALKVTVISDNDPAEYDAPIYFNQTAAIESFLDALDKATKTTYTVKDETGESHTEEHSIRIGSSRYLSLPSFADMVKDGVTPYDEMKYTICYCTESADWRNTTAGLKIPVETAGKYKFFVMFEGVCGKMEREDFIDEDGNITGIYSDYVFEFELFNDAPISVEPASSQEKAYQGVEYTASYFVVYANKYNLEYELYYKNADGTWQNIPALSKMTEGTSEYNTYAPYNFNGSLTFTPVQIGEYKIVLKLTEEGTDRSATAETFITADSAPQKVTPEAENWWLNNVWSLVFLGVGTLSLIGIIVVLCIKPKEENDVAK